MTTFKEMGLKPEIIKALDDLSFEKPTPIQEKTIPHLLAGTKDLIALAQTGTGKTAAFGIPVLQQINPDKNHIQALILSPTRELGLQIANDLKDFSKYMGKVSVAAVYGGANIDTQIKQLKKGVQIVAATPGRALDLIKRRVLKLSNVKFLVLDEADEMLSMGFKDDLDAILEQTPKEKQTLLFSATMPKEILRIAQKYMDSPEEISAGKKNTGAENVRHIYYMVSARDRYLALKRIADINPKIYGIVFCRTRRETKEVADKLMADGYNADALHGDLSQSQRDYVMDRFRKKHLQLLVATDVAARGLDVNNLSHIINYNLPDELEVYIHRSGRTGRAGKKGISISIIHSKEKSKIRTLEKKVGKSFEYLKVPGGKEICEKQLFNLVDIMENIAIDEQQIEPFMPEIYKKLEWMSREDLIKRFVSVEFNRFLDYYKNSRDLNVSAKSQSRDEGKRSNSGRRGRNSNFSRFFISLGSRDKVNAVKLIGLINDNTRSKDIEIGKIDIMKSFSFFEVEKSQADKILKSFQNAKHNGTKISVELAQSKGEPEKKVRDNKFGKRNDRKKDGFKRRRNK